MIHWEKRKTISKNKAKRDADDLIRIPFYILGAILEVVGQFQVEFQNTKKWNIFQYYRV